MTENMSIIDVRKAERLDTLKICKEKVTRLSFIAFNDWLDSEIARLER